MKKNILFIIIIICIVTAICYLRPQSLYDAAGISSYDITRIIFYDGRGGRNEPVIIDNPQKIEELSRLLNNYWVIKDNNPKIVAGWIHHAVFYKNDEQIMDVTFGNPIKINKSDYRVLKGNLSIEKIGRFLKSINAEYDIYAGLEE